MTTRRQFAADFKARVALEALRGDTAGRRSSTRIRARNSPASTSLLCSRTRASRSPWTAGAAAWTISSSNVCGRSLKYEAVYLHELTDGFRAEQVIRDWIEFYNTERPHFALAGQTPAEAYDAGRPVDMMDEADALPTSPQAQQQQKDLINEILAA